MGELGFWVLYRISRRKSGIRECGAAEHVMSFVSRGSWDCMCAPAWSLAGARRNRFLAALQPVLQNESSRIGAVSMITFRYNDPL